MSHSRTLLLTLLLQPARAVFISQWANCLSPSINATDPIQLQWVPLYVGTVFATSDTGHKLTVTVWGNVSGTYQTTDTTDANFTATEILRDPFPTSVAKITTLHSEIDVLTYEPYSASLNFCDDALINATCPLGPVTDTTDMYVFPRSFDANLFYPLMKARKGKRRKAFEEAELWMEATFAPPFSLQELVQALYAAARTFRFASP